MREKIKKVVNFVDLVIFGLVFTIIVMPVMLIAALFGVLDEM